MNIEKVQKRISNLHLIKHNGTKNSTLSESELREITKQIGEIALQHGILCTALDSYIELGELAKIKEIGERSLNEGWIRDAYNAFMILGDKDGLFRVIQTSEGKDRLVLKDSRIDYVGNQLLEEIDSRFQNWATEKGIEGAYTLEFCPQINIAYHISRNYDIGVGIARGGLTSAYIFGLFGLHVKVAQCHKKEKGATFEWIDEICAEDFEGKNVAIFDKDVVTGRTARKTLEELQKYKPNTLNLILNNNPIRPSSHEQGTKLANIPREYNSIVFPKDFNYQEFDKAVAALEARF